VKAELTLGDVVRSDSRKLEMLPDFFVTLERITDGFFIFLPHHYFPSWSGVIWLTTSHLLLESQPMCPEMAVLLRHPIQVL